MNDMTCILYFDCMSGISGNMILGSLFDLGLSPEDLKSRLTGLAVESWDFTVDEVRRGAFRACFCEVSLHHHAHSHRTLDDIEAMIDKGALPGAAAENAKKVFQLLAEAEGKVHGKDPRTVTFHEVGAVDSIVDIAGVCTGLELLGIEHIACSPLLLGRGETASQHGKIPVPAPATVELVKNLPIRQTDQPFEMTTPTGAALMAALSETFGPLPDMIIKDTGYGAGSDRPTEPPNVLRVFRGTRRAAPEEEAAVRVLETNIDNASAEETGYLLEQLMDAGALDAFLSPILMKKGRLAQKLSVLCRESNQAALELLIFRSIPTLGIRSYPASRTVLERSHKTINTQWGPIQVKESFLKGEKLRTAVEYESLKAVSQKTGIAIDRLRTMILRDLEA